MTVSSARGRERVAGARAGLETGARRPEFGWLARTGLVARGVVYGVIGILALELALGSGGQTASQRGALEAIAGQPFGRVLLVAVCVGLAAYAVWRLITAVAPSPGGRDKPGALDRITAGVSGIAYVALCVTAIKILAGASTSGGSNSPKQDTAGVLGWPGGPVIVGIAGAILIGVAAFQVYKGISRRFEEDSRTEQMSPAVQRGFTALGIFGHVARGVVFALIGYGLLKAAIDYAPHSAIGLDGALAKLAHASYGPLLLGVVAAGLTGFALYSVADARYHRV